jgi:hypothetical protein
MQGMWGVGGHGLEIFTYVTGLLGVEQDFALGALQLWNLGRECQACREYGASVMVCQQ